MLMKIVFPFLSLFTHNVEIISLVNFIDNRKIWENQQ